MINKLKKVYAGVRREGAKSKIRSPEWRKVRAEFLIAHSKCAACNGTTLLQVHHIKPFHLEPKNELDHTNLLTLCIWKLCHLEVGHGDDYSAYNPEVIDHAKEINKNPASRERIILAAKVTRKYS